MPASTVWAPLVALVALLPAVRAGCQLELQISAPDTVLDVAGTLGALIDIELVSTPPTAFGSIFLSVPGDCPSSAEGWASAGASISSGAIAVLPDSVALKAAVVHVDVSGARFELAPALLRPLEGSRVHAEPAVRMTSGTAQIGQKAFALAGGDGRGSLNATLSSLKDGGVELQISEVRVVFSVDVSEIEGDTKIIIQGSILARQGAATIERVQSARAPPPATRQTRVEALALTAAPGSAVVTAAPAAVPPTCDPPCSTHGTCVQRPGAAASVGVCKCNCNFIGADCSHYAPLRLSTVAPESAPFGEPFRVTIKGDHLGELASLPPPAADEGPPFRVQTKGGQPCTDLAVIDATSVACKLPAQLPGTEVRFDVRRGCATAPFAPAALVRVAGCADPSTLSCGTNERARADGCGCECEAGWRGEMCNSCDTDMACAPLAHATSAADGAAAEAVAADDEEPLACRKGDFAFYAGTYEKVLSCSLQDLPAGIEPLVISLACARAELAAQANCTLLVAPADAQDRAEIGAEGMLRCVATGCDLVEGEPSAHCTDVSCSFGIYEAAIKAALPDLKVGGPSNVDCKPPAPARGGGGGAADASSLARCFVDVDVLPFQIMAQCTTSDCVQPSQLAGKATDDGTHMIAIAVAVTAAVLCACVALVLWFAQSMRMAPAAAAAPGADEAGGRTHLRLPADLNAMPKIEQLLFDDVRVTVASGREIVCGASGVARAGEVYGVIGASGSGKTTLLDAVAGVLTPGASRTGTVLVGSHAIPLHGVRLPAMVGYVRQEDNLSLTLTPRECVWFAAQLTLPLSASKAQRSAAVDATLASLGLSHIADTQLGGSAKAAARVSGGERRRVAIACAMVCSPRVLLLDEPTSGLDSASAHRLVSTLRELASHGRVVMLSIHQPAQRTFELLHTALLMHQGAPVVVGEISQLRERVAIAGAPCPAGYNLADHLLDLSSDAAVVARLRADAADELATRELPALGAGAAPWDAVREAYGWRGAAAQVLAELRALYWRIGLNVYRHPSLLRLHLAVVLVLGPAVGLVFHGVGDNLASFQNRSGACFFVLALFGFSGLSAMEVFISEQEVMLRELQAGYYRLSAYFAAKISVDALLLRTLPAILFSVIFYPTMGLRPEAARFSTFLIICTLVNIASGMLCAAISVLFDSLGAANLAATILMLLLLLMNGALVNLREVAAPLRLFQQISFFRYGFEAILTNELEDTVVMVDAPGIMPIPVKSRVFLAVLGMDADNIERDKVVLALFCVGYALLALVLLYTKASTWRPKCAATKRARAEPRPQQRRQNGDDVRLSEVTLGPTRKAMSTTLL